MELTRKDDQKIHLVYLDGKPAMTMKTEKVKMIFCFSESPPDHDAKQTIVDILTAQHTKKITGSFLHSCKSEKCCYNEKAGQPACSLKTK